MSTKNSDDYPAQDEAETYTRAVKS